MSTTARQLAILTLTFVPSIHAVSSQSEFESILIWFQDLSLIYLSVNPNLPLNAGTQDL